MDSRLNVKAPAESASRWQSLKRLVGSGLPAGPHWCDFDDLARDLARGLSRRQALRRVGEGLLGAVLASLGLGRAWAQGNSNCAYFCSSIYPPGPKRGDCTTAAAHGQGLCVGCGPAAPAGHPDVCGLFGGPRFCCPAALPDCCSGTCVSKQTDVNNCGACGNICPERAHATRVCNQGVCGYVCSAGFGDCDASADNGCEANLSTDAANCGACGATCPEDATACCGNLSCCPTNHPQCCAGGGCCPSNLQCCPDVDWCCPSTFQCCSVAGCCPIPITLPFCQSLSVGCVFCCPESHPFFCLDVLGREACCDLSGSSTPGGVVCATLVGCPKQPSRIVF